MLNNYALFYRKDPMEGHIKGVRDTKYLRNLIGILEKDPEEKTHLTMARERLREICLTDNF
jgi:hypothetical protein|tara:strand:- start:1212 stop:1394 length:183 start_codon:yes stop_codon:yes gene_type:complete